MTRGSVALVAALSCLLPVNAHARLRTSGQPPGSFDYYVLSMTWSPQSCFEPTGASERFLCGKGRRHAFALSGLQPRNDRGAPQACAPAAPLPTHLVDAMLDIMPEASLVRREWQEHGTCSGLGPTAYFDKSRAAFQSVSIPAAYKNPREVQRVTPSRLAQQFVIANPKLAPADIAVRCDGHVLREVHVCLDRSLEPRPCGLSERTHCHAGEIIVPPVP